LRPRSRYIIGHFPQTKQLNVGSFADSYNLATPMLLSQLLLPI
jgi:hypothetical protein